MSRIGRLLSAQARRDAQIAQAKRQEKIRLLAEVILATIERADILPTEALAEAARQAGVCGRCWIHGCGGWCDWPGTG